jgi:hypothetical protein
MLVGAAAGNLRITLRNCNTKIYPRKRSKLGVVKILALHPEFHYLLYIGTFALGFGCADMIIIDAYQRYMEYDPFSSCH